MQGIRCDVSSSESVAQMFTQIRERFGTLDILVNNAALVPASPADEERRNRHYAYVTTPMPRQSLGVTSSLTDEDWLKWSTFTACSSHASVRVKWSRRFGRGTEDPSSGKRGAQENRRNDAGRYRGARPGRGDPARRVHDHPRLQDEADLLDSSPHADRLWNTMTDAIVARAMRGTDK